jgi:DNA topoisomerase-1
VQLLRQVRHLHGREHAFWLGLHHLDALFGPYLQHDGKYAKLTGTAEIFEIGMNAAVARIADAANRGSAGGGREPLKILGAHPRTEVEIKLMAGRYGAYVTDGSTNATLPKAIDKDAITLEEAAQLIDERAAKGPAKKKRKTPAKKKKAPAKKRPAAKKKAAAKKETES